MAKRSSSPPTALPVALSILRGRLIYIDTVDRARLGAHVAGDALVRLELMDAAVARREGQVLLGILDGDGLLEAVLERDLHADGDRGHVVDDVFEIRFGRHRSDECKRPGKMCNDMGTCADPCRTLRDALLNRSLRLTVVGSIAVIAMIGLILCYQAIFELIG